MKAPLASFALLLLAGCKVMSADEARDLRERASGRFDGVAWVERAWDKQLMPQFESMAVAKPADDDKAVIVKGEGIISAIDVASRTGSVTLSGDVRLLTGPMIVSTALRDAIPSIRFNDFSDQLAFAEINKALNEKATGATRGKLASLKVGDKIRYIGAARASTDGVVEIIPVRID